MSLNLVFNESLYYLLYSGSDLKMWLLRLGQNSFDHSGCRIFKSNISLEKKWWIRLSFCMLIQIHGHQKLIEKYWGGCGQGIKGMNWFLAWWYKFRKAKSYCNNYKVCAVKVWDVLLGHATLKFTVSQWMDELSWFFARWCKFRKAKSYLERRI